MVVVDSLEVEVHLYLACVMCVVCVCELTRLIIGAAVTIAEG